MRRREFIAGLGATAWPLLVSAQQRTKLTIGWLAFSPGFPDLGLWPEALEGLRRGLAEVGFAEGRDVTLERLSAVVITSGCRRLLPIWCA